MLRRLPTPLTISPEDLQTFEETIAHRIAYASYLKTGQDPEGLFTNTTAINHNNSAQGQKVKTRDAKIREESKAIDPNDELKPLPGDKARIVRGREERIMGVPGGRRG